MKPLHLKLATVLLSSLAALGVAELVARKTYGEGFTILVDPYEDHSYRPYVKYEQVWGDRTTPLYTNSLGWKDRRPGHEVEKESPLTRIVFLGDSFTEGLGCIQEETVSGVVERELNARGARFEVLNGGRSSYSPILEYQRLKKFFAAGYETDTVVLLYDVSDPQDEIAYSARYQFAADGEPLRFRGWSYHPFVRALYNHSALVRSVRRAAGPPPPRAPTAAEEGELPPDFATAPISAQRLLTLSPKAYGAVRANWIVHPPSLAGWAQEGLKSSFENIRRIRRLAEEHGARLLVVIYPGPQMLYTRDDPARYALLKERFPRVFADREAVCGKRPAPLVNEYQRQVRAMCVREGIELLDLVPELQKAGDWPRLYIPGDVHWNEQGNRFVGLRIAEALRKRPR
jgi:lysophospholipase L1-like esterase